MSEWKCGKCGKEYEFDEFMELEHVKAVEEDTNPKKQHGFVSVCECGYVFHKDKWQMKEKIEIDFNDKKINVDVSTVFLELNHFGYYYETMIFADGNIDCNYQGRFVTKEEAEKNHKEIVKKIKDGNFKIEKDYDYNNRYDLTLSQFDTNTEVQE